MIHFLYYILLSQISYTLGFVLPPHSRISDRVKGSQTAIIIVQGVSIKPSKYAGLAQAIQKHAKNPLWIATPETLFDTPLSILGAGRAIEQAKQELIKAGFDENGDIILVGHSLGGVEVQEYVHTYPTFAKGIVLMGSALLRKFNESNPLQVPVMSVNGELDAQFRPMRSAEAYYHLIKDNKKSIEQRPVIIVPGLTHMAAATYDEVPLVVRRADLCPFVTEEEAHERLAKLITAFTTLHTDTNEDVARQSFNTLKEAVESTGRFLSPLIQSLELEASYHLKPPCNSDTPSPHCPFYPEYPPYKNAKPPSMKTDCFCGSPLTLVANEVMAGLNATQFGIETVDTFQNVAETRPIHLPHLWNSCVNATSFCTLNVTTVSENVYGLLDNKLDTGSSLVSALEIRMKLKSRQAYMQVTTDKDAALLDFRTTDPPSLCQEINQKMYQIAVDLAEPRRLEFYKKYGTPLVFDQDFNGALPAGPLWIYNPLHFQPRGFGKDRKMHVISPGFVSQLNSPFAKFSQYVVGFHYCKIVSPARVLEWIYTDSLRDQLGWRVPKVDYVLDKFP